MDSVEVFHQYRPIRDHGSILITTQDPDIAATASLEIPLRPLADKEGASLLLSYLHHGDQSNKYEQAQSICHELGEFPLAIIHIASYVRQSQISLAKFLEHYQSAYSQKYADKYTSLYRTEYEKTYSMVWSIALNELPKNARDFIRTLAFFSPDGVPEDIFLADLITSKQDLAENEGANDQAGQSQYVDDMVRHLRKRSLIERCHYGDSDSRLAIHRQLQHSLILLLSQDIGRSQRVFAHAVTLLRHVFPHQNAIIEHMNQALDSMCSVCGSGFEFVPHTPARILCDCGQYLWGQSLNESAGQLLQLPLNLCDGNSFRSEHLDLKALMLFRQCSVEMDGGYSGILRAMPKLKAAIDIQRGVLDEMRRIGANITAESEISFANGLNNLGCCYLHLSRYGEAEPLLQQLLDIKNKEKWSKEESISYALAESYKNIAFVRAAQNQIQEALEMSHRSVHIMEQCTDPRSSRTYFFRFICACILFDSGAIELALIDHLEILEARRRILGEAHNYTASSYYMAGFTYYNLGRFQEAE